MLLSLLQLPAPSAKRFVFLTAGAALVLACGGPAPPVGERLRSYAADVVLEFDLASPVARPFLIEGWRLADDVARGAGEPAALTQGLAPRSTLAFVGFGEHDRRLTLRGRPVGGDVGVELRVSGQVVASEVLAERGGTLTFDIPAGAWAPGVNVLELRYSLAEPSGHSHGRAAESGSQAVRGGGAGSAPGDGEVGASPAEENSAGRADPGGGAASAPGEGGAAGRGFPGRGDPVVDWVALRLTLRDAEAEAPLRTLFSPAGGSEVALRSDDAKVPVLGRRTAVRAHQDGTDPTELQLGGADTVPVLPDRPALLEVAAEFEERPVLYATTGDAAKATEEPCRRRRSNVIVYLVDTLRRDRLGVYGSDQGLSPHLDALAERSWVWRRAVAQSSWTRPTVATVMTGLGPLRHGVNGRDDVLGEQHTTLAEAFAQAGWQTAGIVTNPNVSGRHGFRQGFDAYRLLSEPSAGNVNRRALAWLDARESADAERPFFLYLHTVEPHAPYAPSAEFRERFAPDVPAGRRFPRKFMNQLSKGERTASARTIAEIEALYDATVAENDAAFGELLAALEERALMESTAVVFLSDHGEEFAEHGGWEHGKTLHTEQIDIPLVAWLPGCGARELIAPAGQLDVAATVLDWAGVIDAAGVDGDFGEGRSLLWAGSGSGTAAAGPSRPFVEEQRDLFSFLRVDQYAGAALSSWPLRRVEAASPRFRGAGTWSRAEDPRETRDLAAELPIASAWLHLELRRRFATGVASAGRVDETELSEEMVRQLRALGYVE